MEKIISPLSYHCDHTGILDLLVCPLTDSFERFLFFCSIIIEDDFENEKINSLIGQEIKSTGRKHYGGYSAGLQYRVASLFGRCLDECMHHPKTHTLRIYVQFQCDYNMISSNSLKLTLTNVYPESDRDTVCLSSPMV